MATENSRSLLSKIAKLEGHIEGLQHVQVQLMIVITIVVAFEIGFGFYELIKLDTLADRVGTLNEQVIEFMHPGQPHKK